MTLGCPESRHSFVDARDPGPWPGHSRALLDPGDELPATRMPIVDEVPARDARRHRATAGPARIELGVVEKVNSPSQMNWPPWRA